MKRRTLLFLGLAALVPAAIAQRVLDCRSPKETHSPALYGVPAVDGVYWLQVEDHIDWWLVFVDVPIGQIDLAEITARQTGPIWRARDGGEFSYDHFTAGHKSYPYVEYEDVEFVGPLALPEEGG